MPASIASAEPAAGTARSGRGNAIKKPTMTREDRSAPVAVF